MRKSDALIIGGGQAGLAMSRSLADLGIDHVVLERGRVANRWRTERWDSLRLLTPNWQSRLPGWRYAGPDPDGYMTMPEVIDYLTQYAHSLPVPVEESTCVLAVRQHTFGYRVTTTRGEWLTRNVVIATGYSDVPSVPSFSARLSENIDQRVPSRYRNPHELPEGGVLVVGASASGVQLAEEIQQSGRQVTLSVGTHTRLPRTYRGRDIMWWLDAMGLMRQDIDEVANSERSQRQPSLQLVGRPERTSIDLGTVTQAGVRLVGRTLSAQGTRVHLADDLEQTTAHAARKLNRLLRQIDQFIAADPDSHPTAPAELPSPIQVPRSPSELNLRAAGIRTVLWATGFRRQYPWLHLPVLDEHGDLRHTGGLVPAPGVYTLGLYFQRRRNSNFIDGVGADARALACHLAARLHATSRAAA